jgi:hypothetical protein
VFIPLSRAGALAWLLVITSASRVLTQATTKEVTALTALPLSTWHAPDSATRSCQRPGRTRVLLNCPSPAATFSATLLKDGVRLVIKLENACQWQYRAEYRMSRDTLQVWMWPVDYREDAGCPGTWYDAWETTVPHRSDSVHRAALHMRPPSRPGAPDVTVEIARLLPEK